MIRTILFTLASLLVSFTYKPSFSSKLNNENVSYLKKTIPNKRVEGTNSSLWTPVSSFEDGSFYMIRSVANTNLYWDLTGGNLTNGTEVQLYNVNYSNAQKFIFRKQFDYQGHATYRLSPLYAYEKVLRVNNDSEDTKVTIASETYTDVHLYSDKFAFIPTYTGSTQFYISSSLTGLGKKFTVSSVASGQKIVQKNGPSNLPDSYKWEIVKTDYVGLNVGNKVYINGETERRFVARPPYVGEYVIETCVYNGLSLDTCLRLVRDSDSTQVAFNDDGGYNYNAKITYNFTTVEEHSIYVRGYNEDVTGYCYLVFRPKQTIYMTGTYDINNQQCDRVTALNNAKTYCRNMGYFCEVYGNLKHQTVFSQTDWENTNKIDRDYYLFYGHGNNGTAAVFFDGDTPDWTYYTYLPSMNNAGLVVWMICHGAQTDPANGRYTSMVHESVNNGADCSLGYEGVIYDITCNSFIPNLFEQLNNHSLEDAIVEAVRQALLSNWAWYVFVNQTQCDIINPIIVYSNPSKSSSILIDIPDIDKTKQKFNMVDGFICKKRDNLSSLSYYFGIYEKRISELKSEWDDVILFAVKNSDDSISFIASCVNRSFGTSLNYDLQTGNSINSVCFEKMMRIDEVSELWQ